MTKKEKSFIRGGVCSPKTRSRGSFRAVKIGNTNKKLVVDPTSKKFPYRTNLVNDVTLTRYLRTCLSAGEL
jgi:hypothetical protein